MKVSELILKLQKLPQDHLVVMSCDPEGNWYQELRDVDVGFFKESQFYRLEEEDWYREEYEEDIVSVAIPCVTFWPA